MRKVSDNVTEVSRDAAPYILEIGIVSSLFSQTIVHKLPYPEQYRFGLL